MLENLNTNKNTIFTHYNGHNGLMHMIIEHQLLEIINKFPY